MELTNIAMIFVVFSTIIIGGVFWMQDFNTRYYGVEGARMFDTSNFTELSQKGNLTTFALEENSTMLGSVESTSSGAGMFVGAYRTVKLFGNTFEWFFSSANIIADALEIPSAFVQIAYGAFILIVIVTIILLIFGRLPS